MNASITVTTDTTSGLMSIRFALAMIHTLHHAYSELPIRVKMEKKGKNGVNLVDNLSGSQDYVT
ncbi:unnamed protein product, partial [marine sediment metagenome]